MAKPDFLTLQRRQLDAQLGPAGPLRSALTPPTGGWIRTIRESLGMSLRQLAQRLQVTKQAVAELEEGERTGTITLASLRAVADVLDCDVAIALVPRTSLEDFVLKQAHAKVRAMRRRIAHTMGLEGQATGADTGLVSDETADTEQWRTTFLKRLWD